LDSSFVIKRPEVFDSGYATFKIKNTGKKDLLINGVEINGKNYNYFIGNGTQTIEQDSEDLVWVETDQTLQIDDVVNITVTAQSEALFGRKYTFTNRTGNLFVKEARAGEIKINKENSIVIQRDTTSVDLYLEVENVGDSIVILDRFYLNNDTSENEINQGKIDYKRGSPILEPNNKVNIFIKNVTANFSPTKYNKIGVATPNDIYDELMFTSNKENFSLSILSENRIVSPEQVAVFNNHFRNHIPVNFNQSYAYIYDNGSMLLNIHVKNTGDIPCGIDTIYLTETFEEVSIDDYSISGDTIFSPNEEDVIKIEIDAIDVPSYGLSGEINEEILVCITGNYGNETVSSDIGYLHTIRDEANIDIIEEVQGLTISTIYANETGKLLIKNTGDEKIDLTNIYVNNTLVSNINYTYGDSSLDVQECAIVTFDIPNLIINDTNEVEVKVTSLTAEVIETLNAFVDPVYYNVTIDDSGTSAVDGGALTILIDNNGKLNVTIDSVYINNTYFSINAFSSDNGYEIGAGGSLELTIDMSQIPTATSGKILVIIVRTIEGAEDTQEEIVS
jgi:hypothetical protein